MSARQLNQPTPLTKGYSDWAVEIEAADADCPPCTQACRQGRECPARVAQVSRMSMWDLEIDRPLWLLIYAVVIVATVAASAFWPEVR